MEDWKKKTDDFWKSKLSPEQYAICRKGATERAFTGKYNHYKEKGVYHCVGCDLPLFRSSEKYDSGSGWPSYWAPVDQNNLERHEDNSHGMIRVEIRCARCSSHLGHVFDDGPAPTYQRYCINSESLNFKKDS